MRYRSPGSGCLVSTHDTWGGMVEISGYLVSLISAEIDSSGGTYTLEVPKQGVKKKRFSQTS